MLHSETRCANRTHLAIGSNVYQGLLGVTCSRSKGFGQTFGHLAELSKVPQAIFLTATTYLPNENEKIYTKLCMQINFGDPPCVMLANS